ncbi:hypothetical protein ABH920_009810 [Catenulispora sp. EB89]|uniref:hypothetical protein n=1 Tax=Catenulispora sp. EB89 TaxID=3156257 RepID=UPI0035154440
MDLQSDTTSSIGDAVAAVDVDGTVYRSGSAAWIRDVWFLILGPLGLLLWSWTITFDYSGHR